jgi:hypothetical protein
VSSLVSTNVHLYWALKQSCVRQRLHSELLLDKGHTNKPFHVEAVFVINTARRIDYSCYRETICKLLHFKLIIPPSATKGVVTLHRACQICNTVTILVYTLYTEGEVRCRNEAVVQRSARAEILEFHPTRSNEHLAQAQRFIFVYVFRTLPNHDYLLFQPEQGPVDLPSAPTIVSLTHF